jgi:hypothetical protein
MFNVFLILLASLISPLIVSTYFFDNYLYDAGYVIYSTVRALVYLSFALAGAYLAKIEINKSNNFNAILICLLSLCMTVTAMFNLIMINTSIYYALNEIKSGPGFSWSSIYSSVEILIAFIVGGHGLNYLAHMGGFNNSRDMVNNSPDLDHWTGKYK